MGIQTSHQVPFACLHFPKVSNGVLASAGGHETNNHIGVRWPPGLAPVLVTSYLTQTSAELGVRDRAIAEVGRVVAGLVVGDNSG